MLTLLAWEFFWLLSKHTFAHARIHADCRWRQWIKLLQQSTTFVGSCVALQRRKEKQIKWTLPWMKNAFKKNNWNYILCWYNSLASWQQKCLFFVDESSKWAFEVHFNCFFFLFNVTIAVHLYRNLKQPFENWSGLLFPAQEQSKRRGKVSSKSERMAFVSFVRPPAVKQHLTDSLNKVREALRMDPLDWIRASILEPPC